MKKLFVFILLPLLMLNLSVAVVAPLDAEAARLGGGRSFGGRPSFNRSAPAPARQPASPAQQNRTANPAAPNPTAARGGFLGPLLAGTALGALLFGGGFAGVGGMDILLLALVAFMAFRLFSARRRPAQQSAGQVSQGVRYGNASGDAYTGSSAWDQLRTAPQGGEASATAEGLRLPADFDLADFMNGAKLVFARMQSSWDKRDLNDIASFTTPAMHRLIQEQAVEDPTPSRTDVIMVEGSLTEFEEAGGEQHAAVLFDAMLREKPTEAPHDVRELWHFTRGGTYGQNWRLDGIQQVR